ncbi:MAG: hypothetical protein L0J35_02840, partial [Tetragenococcus halophilus]|nr:hypothetical protein [Tetragenococcus halophilus]
NKKILAVGLFLFMILVILSVIYWQNSTKHQAKLLTEAIVQKDYAAFHKVTPSFNDGTKLNKETFLVFAESIPKKDKEAEIKKRVNNDSLFEKKKGKSWFAPTKFMPYPRYFGFENEETSQVTFSIGKHLLSGKGKRVGPLIGGDYPIDYTVSSPIYGKMQQTQQTDLRKENQTVTLDEKEAFIASKNFQEKLLNQVVSYYIAMNQGLQNDLDFSGVTQAQEETKASLQQTFDELRPYIESVEQTFQKFVMNSESLKIEGSSQPQAVFDIYTDVALSLKANNKGKRAEEITNASHNAIVTMEFDQETKKWLIYSIDFETYTQQPDDWAHTNEVTLPEINQARWYKDGRKQGNI